MTLKVPIGIDNFSKLRELHYTYVDKSLFIDEVFAEPAEVLLITRPRRFGKTLNLSMLRYFLDRRMQSGSLFADLKISRSSSFKWLNSKPVMFMTFKNLKAASYQEFIGKFRDLIVEVYREFRYLYETLDPLDQDVFLKFSKGTDDLASLSGAISWLMRCLFEVHGQRVWVLIDEYDSPLHEAFHSGYYPDVIGFMRGVLGSVLKGHSALEKAVLTGILRLAKESIFSDLNHIKVHSLISPQFANRFGFTEHETLELLQQAGLGHKADLVQDWYNGYQMGDETIYNPWSLLNFLQDGAREPEAYWVNTSSNDLIREQVMAASPAVQDHFKALMNGGTVWTFLNLQTTFRDLSTNDKNLWSLLLFSGYLTIRDQTIEDHQKKVALAIPNREVLILFKTIISDWLVTQVGSHGTQAMLNALVKGDVEQFGRHLAELVEAIFSYYDTGGKQEERIYHIFVLGLLAQLSHRFIIRSNRESGLGRYDLMMIPKTGETRGIVMEFKRANTPADLDQALTDALNQIKERHYLMELDAHNVTERSVIAVAFCGKMVRVRRM